MNVVQVRLSSGTQRLTCYLEDIIQEGYMVILKDDPDTVWTVDHIDTEPIDLRTVNRGWSNNI